jgi:hypothetical protein
MDRVAEHCRNLARAGIDGTMLSWTVGGYPSPNLRIAQEYARDPSADPAVVLDRIARERYGKQAVPFVRAAWSKFSTAFREFPHHGTVLYQGPQQLGPANLLHARPTGYRSTMVGYPYDDLNGWRGPYPADVFTAQFRKIADGWEHGIDALQQAIDVTDRGSDHYSMLQEDLRLATAAGIHLASVANQAAFVQARDILLQNEGDEGRRTSARAEIQRLLDAEASLAKALFPLVRADSRIGFEASNQYYYVPTDLIEKVLSCEFLKSRFDQDR